MKSRIQGKASKASLVARGLASKSKPPAFKRVQKGQQKASKESKPGYSLYTSDSEDQASSVDRGLNRCAALLSNILDNEDKDSTAQSKLVVGVSKPVKSTLKRAGATSHPPVKPGKPDTQRTKALSRKVVIPTARADDKASASPSKPPEETQGTSTTYNDRLVSSTPVLTVEERQRRQQLQKREALLQQELTQLKQRYDLLQKQQDPGHHTEQKLQLQSSMMHELESHQQKQTLQRTAHTTTLNRKTVSH
ncbi:protein localization to centrosome [Desmophyllum pertusum]|uniref:Protein localization to centrosome n=1 Tax=Desmophyllum pertusum TaxID=174260 RepID=A0A9W9ZJZ2_9CNID|nr:protein localization to centrosome [Desmophyllum pertusum]